MPRKPAHLANGLGLRQQLWNRIRHRRAANADFSLTDIVFGGESTDTARDYVAGLAKAGYIRLSAVVANSGGRRPQHRWMLIRDTGLEAPRVRRDGAPVTQGLAQEQMWRTLRLLRGDANARELAAHASTPAIPVSPTAAADYLLNLAHAGYLTCTAAARTTMKNGGKSQARYRLKPAVDGKGDTGPRAPMVCRTQVLYDPNNDTTHPIGRVNEEVCIYGK